MLRKTIGISAIFMVLMTAIPSTAPAADNSASGGATKVEGGFKAVGKSAEEIGTKAGKAAEGAAKDTGSALGRAWDSIVRGVKKAFR